MKRVLVLLLAAPALALAASPFDGTWKAHPETQQISGTPDTYDISQGMYHCSSCVPQIDVKADGTDQAVTGHDYYDSVAVRVVDKSAIAVTRKKGGKVVALTEDTVSPDGMMLTTQVVSHVGAAPVRYTYTSKRLKPGSPGSHGVSGTWQQDQVQEASNTAVMVKYQATAKGLHMEWNGQVYDANFGGKQYPVSNDPANTMVVVKRISSHEIEETDYRGGKVVDVTHMTVTSDGKTINAVDTDPVHKTKTVYTLTKES